MQQDEDIQVVGTTTDFLIQELTDEKGGQEFAREYLKADFLAAAVDALFYALCQAGLKKEQAKRVKPMTTTDRRARPHQGPYASSRKAPQSRNADGTWRKKRSDAGKKQSTTTMKRSGK